METYVVVDPGLKHTCVMLATVSAGPRVKVEWFRIYALDGAVNPDVEKAREMMEELGEELERMDPFSLPKLVIEFQPPINGYRNPALIRWNTWIEAFVIGAYSFYSLPYAYVHSNALKKKFSIPSGGSHTVNKTLSMMKARELIHPESQYRVRNDHEADCVLMAAYQFLKDQSNTKE